MNYQTSREQSKGLQISLSSKYSQIYKIISRPRVGKSLKQDFIIVILTKNQRRSKENKKRVRIRKSRYIKLNGTYYYIRKFNVALSLCKVLKITLYSSEGFSEAATRELAVAEVSWPLKLTVVCFLEQESNLWSPVLQ